MKSVESHDKKRRYRTHEVEDELLLDLLVELDELPDDVVTLPCAAMEKEPLVEYTMPILLKEK
jgi:hypothetical protein